MSEERDEQLALLREILAELRRLNANLEKREQARTEEQARIGEDEDAGTEEDDDDDSEELEYFE